MSNYRKGASFERRVRKRLEDGGFIVVRSAGSKGPIDLIAIKKGLTLLIQCKSNKMSKMDALELLGKMESDFEDFCMESTMNCPTVVCSDMDGSLKMVTSVDGETIEEWREE